MTTWRSPDRATELYLVRHALPTYRPGRQADEPPGPGLSHTGREQARQTAEVLAGLDIARVCSSPLARAVQTAEIIARRCSVNCSVAADLREWHRTESLYDVTVRLARWFRHWISLGESRTVLVSHGSPILAVIRTALYLPHRGWRVLHTADQFEVSMASIFALTVTRDRVTVRRVFHPVPRVHEWRDGRALPADPRRRGGPERTCLTRLNPARLNHTWVLD